MGRAPLIPPEIEGEPRSTIPHWALLSERLVPWAERSDNIRALAILGSTVRSDRPGDEWSDMDLLILATDPALLLDSTEWLDGIGRWWASLRHEAPIPDVVVRQVVFEGAADFDLIVIPAGTLGQRIAEHPEGMAEALGVGVRVVVDKDGELGGTEFPTPSAAEAPAPTAERFDWLVNDLLFQFVYAAKHLRRGELWLAKDDIDCYMRGDLRELIEWHARAVGRAAWSGSRYLEQWADPRVLEALPASFGAYSPQGVATGLVGMMDLLGWFGPEVAAQLGFVYPMEHHDAVDGWLRDTLGEGGLLDTP